VPKAQGQKFHYRDHDTDVVDVSPPVQNQWYEVFHAYDVRLIWCAILQANDETFVKTLEIRWTIDGNVYFEQMVAAHNVRRYVFRAVDPSLGGTQGLNSSATAYTASVYTDKRGQDFKVEIRITSALGTNQRLLGYCVRETLELT